MAVSAEGLREFIIRMEKSGAPAVYHIEEKRSETPPAGICDQVFINCLGFILITISGFLLIGFVRFLRKYDQ